MTSISVNSMLSESTLFAVYEFTYDFLKEVMCTSVVLGIVSYFCLKIIHQGLPSATSMILMQEVGADSKCDKMRKSSLCAQHIENYHIESILGNSSNMVLRRNAIEEMPGKLYVLLSAGNLHQYLQRRLGQ